VYTPSPEFAEHAQTWADEVELDLEVVVSDAPLGPGIWLRPDPTWIGWEVYDERDCGIRVAFNAAQWSAPYSWGALMGAAESRTATRIGTALPPEGMIPTLRIDDDQARSVRQGWARFRRTCSGGVAIF